MVRRRCDNAEGSYRFRTGSAPTALRRNRRASATPPNRPCIRDVDAAPRPVTEQTTRRRSAAEPGLGEASCHGRGEGGENISETVFTSKPQDIDRSCPVEERAPTLVQPRASTSPRRRDEASRQEPDRHGGLSSVGRSVAAARGGLIGFLVRVWAVF